jgi:drug/metabolite transporter (DMT)-like permease
MPRYTACRMRYVVIAVLLMIVASMGSALYYLVTDRSGSRRMVKALALRVGLSLALFLALMASYYFGWIPGRL